MSVFRFYLRILQKHPWKTQIITTGILMGSGDVFSQTIIERKKVKEFDSWRTCRFFLLGTCCVGPCIRAWYLTLYRFFPSQSGTTAVKQMLIDQVCFAPIFIASFLVIIGFTQCKSLDEIQDGLHQNYLAVLLTNYKIWPLAQLVNFYIIPIQHRVLFANFIALFWNTYLAWKANRS